MAGILTAMEGIERAITLQSLDPLLGKTLKAEMFREIRFPGPLSRSRNFWVIPWDLHTAGAGVARKR